MEAAIAAPIVLVHNLRMPLLDHFRPPLSQRRHWDSFHGAWAEAIAKHLNQLLLPEGFVAEAGVKLGGQVEIDVGTFAEGGPLSASGPGTAVWAPPKPTATALLDFEAPDSFEVQVLHEEGGLPHNCRQRGPDARSLGRNLESPPNAADASALDHA